MATISDIPIKYPEVLAVVVVVVVVVVAVVQLIFGCCWDLFC